MNIKAAIEYLRKIPPDTDLEFIHFDDTAQLNEGTKHTIELKVVYVAKS